MLVSEPGELVFDREVGLFAGKAREGSLPRQVTDQATKSAGEASASDQEDERGKPMSLNQTRVKRHHNKQSGMAMVLVITILAALLGLASVGLSLQLDSTKSTTLIKDTRASLYCAEAGLAAARDTIVANRSTWGDILDGTGAAWYSTGAPLGITGDADGDGVTGDYSVTILDDGDDAITTTDINDTIVVISKCLLYPKAPVSVKEILSLSGVGYSYRNQSGQGAGNTGNAN